uniref:CSON013285 protein n=1 Tax=Culicoides sonorensis TaxID=179676 RepID=A0A336M7W8_CULSO
MGNMSGSHQDDSDSDIFDVDGISGEMLNENYLVFIFRQLVNRYGDLQVLSTDDEEQMFHNPRLPVIKKKPSLDILHKSEIYQSVGQASGYRANKNHEEVKSSLMSMLAQRQNCGPFKRSIKANINNLFLPTSSKHLKHLGAKVFCGVYSKDGNYFVTAAQDSSIRVFDASTPNYRPINSIQGKHVSWCLLDLNFSHNNEWYVYSTWSDCLHINRLDGSDTDVKCLSLNPELQRFATFSSTFSNCGKEIIAGCNDSCVYVYNVEADRRSLRVEVTEGADVNCVGFLNDTSDIFFSGTDDGIIKVWDKRCLNEDDPQPAGILVGHYDGVTFIDSRNDGRYLISNSKDQSIKLWDLRVFSPKEAEQTALQKYSNASWDYRWDKIPKKYYNMTKCMDGDTSVISYRGHRIQKTLIRARFSPQATTGQRYIYTGCGTGRLVIYDMLTVKMGVTLCWKNFPKLFFGLILLISLGITQINASEDEERLVRDLFRGYNKLIRPVQNMTQKVDVRFGLAFVQLINVNEKNQIMKSNVWLRLVWSDYQLQWDEADYGGIGVLRLPPDKVWKPDIVLFNNADGNYEVRYKSNVLIYPNGEVLWVPPAIYQSSCTIDVTYFPFDQQTCIMKFGSWTFNGDQVSLALYNNKNFVDLSDYWKSGTWDIIEVPAYLNVYEGNHPTETDITFYIIIRRKTLFYTVNLILPTVLISFLCVLVFYLPAEAGEKVTLGISILLSLVVFLLLVSKILPPTSLVLPLIAKYLLFTFIMNTVSILVTVVIINWNFRGPRTHRMPMWIRTVFLHYLPAMLLMKRPRKTRLRWMMEMPGMSVPPHPNSSYGSPSEIPKHIGGMGGGAKQSKMEVMELSDMHHPNCRMSKKLTPGGDLGVGDPCRRESESSDSILLSPEASKATEAVEFIAEHLRNEDLYIQTREDWKYVAMWDSYVNIVSPFRETETREQRNSKRFRSDNRSEDSDDDDDSEPRPPLRRSKRIAQQRCNVSASEIH